MLIEHFRVNWSNHLAAGTSTVFSLLNGSHILEGILIGVGTFICTKLLAHFLPKLFQ